MITISAPSMTKIYFFRVTPKIVLSVEELLSDKGDDSAVSLGVDICIANDYFEPPPLASEMGTSALGMSA